MFADNCLLERNFFGEQRFKIFGEIIGDTKKEMVFSKIYFICRLEHVIR